MSWREPITGRLCCHRCYRFVQFLLASEFCAISRATWPDSENSFTNLDWDDLGISHLKKRKSAVDPTWRHAFAKSVFEINRYLIVIYRSIYFFLRVKKIQHINNFKLIIYLIITDLSISLITLIFDYDDLKNFIIKS